jgi:hypothetical protein
MGEELDIELGKELEIFYENDSDIYHQRTIPWYKNFLRKMHSNRYNHALAVKGIAENFVPVVAAKYRKDYGDFGNVNRATKYWMAERFVNDFESEAKLGNYDNLLK